MVLIEGEGGNLYLESYEFAEFVNLLSAKVLDKDEVLDEINRLSI